MPNGKINNMSNEAYHADRTHISKSNLDKLAKSPAHFKWSLDNPEEPTLAMEIGTMTHTFILEPSEFENRYAIQPKFDGRTKEGKAAKDLWARQNGCKKPITEDYMTILEGMKRSVYANKSAGKLLSSDGEAEVSFFGQVEGVNCKCRFDWITKDGIAVDLKTTEAANMTDFGRSVWSFRYFVQAPFYKSVAASCGVDIKRFFFLAVEKGAPHACCLYEIDEAGEIIGTETYKKQLDLYKSCLEMDSWPAYGHEIEKLSLPKWATA